MRSRSPSTARRNGRLRATFSPSSPRRGPHACSIRATSSAAAGRRSTLRATSIHRSLPRFEGAGRCCCPTWGARVCTTCTRTTLRPLSSPRWTGRRESRASPSRSCQSRRERSPQQSRRQHALAQRARHVIHFVALRSAGAHAARLCHRHRPRHVAIRSTSPANPQLRASRLGSAHFGTRAEECRVHA